MQTLRTNQLRGSTSVLNPQSSTLVSPLQLLIHAFYVPDAFYQQSNVPSWIGVTFVPREKRSRLQDGRL